MPRTAKSNKRGWTNVAFGDVVRHVKDRVDPEQSGLERYIGGEHMDTDDLRIRRWGEVGDGYLGPAFHMRFKPGHVLYGSRRTYLRKVAIADFEGITANTTYVLEPKDTSVLLPELLPFIMQTHAFNQHSVRESKGSVNPYVNFSDLAWFAFALPPIEEQRRISRGLIALQSHVEGLRELASRSEALHVSALNEFFTPRLASAQPLGRVAGIHAGGTPSRANKAWWGGTLPWASAKDMKVRELATTEERLTKDGWSVAKIAPKGATLIVVRGMILAHTFPVARCVVPMAFNQDLRALVPGDDLLPDYLTLWAEWAGPWFLSRAGESSHGTKRLEGHVLDSAPIPVPSKDVQRAFVSRQQQIQSAIGGIGNRLENARGLKQLMFESMLEMHWSQ
jgi:type I restriction enzyme S subunit